MTSRAALLVALLTSGCGLSLLPTTLFYARLAEGEDPDASAWSELLLAAPASFHGSAGTGSSVVAAEHLDGGGWLAWTATTTTDPARVEGALVRARRTEVGLEAQAFGSHVGPAVRVTLRCFRVDGTPLIVIESSEGERSIERSAWVYVERGGSIGPADLGEGARYLPLHRDSTVRIDERWDRARTVTATLEGVGDALVVHEHATVREIARDRPEVPARAVREVDRDRRLILDGQRLVADRPSLFDEP